MHDTLFDSFVASIAAVLVLANKCWQLPALLCWSYKNKA